jgi:membrane protein
MKNTYKQLTKIVAKTLLLAMPFIFLLTIYFVKDPYMVLREYEDYDHPVLKQQHVGYVTWHKFLKYNPQKHYDSFIMGASTTSVFTCEEWNKHIQGTPIRIASLNEGLYDTYAKIKALDEIKEQKIKNILIITNPNLLAITKPQVGIIHAISPEICGMSKFNFQLTYLKSFLELNFYRPYLTFLFTGKYDKSQIGIINNGEKCLTKYTNDSEKNKEVDDLIEQKGFQAFYETHKANFTDCKNRTPKMLPAVLKEPQIEMLKALKKIVDKHHTNLKLVLTPGLNQDYMNNKDFAILQQTLGKENVFSYELNVHKELNKIENFHDGEHFRRRLARYILNDIYGKVKE